MIGGLELRKGNAFVLNNLLEINIILNEFGRKGEIGYLLVNGVKFYFLGLYLQVFSSFSVGAEVPRSTFAMGFWC